jgi:hypothetical protein
MRFLGLTSVIGAGIAMPASQPGSMMPVSATVAPRVDLMVHSPARLTVTATDVAQGYVTVSEPLRLRLSGNTPQGVELDLRAAPALFSAMRIEGTNLDATLPGDGGTIAWRWRQSSMSLNVDLRFTFMLRPELLPGTYSWPISVNGRALETGPIQTQ